MLQMPPPPPQTTHVWGGTATGFRAEEHFLGTLSVSCLWLIWILSLLHSFNFSFLPIVATICVSLQNFNTFQFHRTPQKNMNKAFQQFPWMSVRLQSIRLERPWKGTEINPLLPPSVSALHMVEKKPVWSSVFCLLCLSPFSPPLVKNVLLCC